MFGHQILVASMDFILQPPPSLCSFFGANLGSVFSRIAFRHRSGAIAKFIRSGVSAS
jgi:hypothetical protein